MSSWQSASMLAGGIGLFLIGVSSMSDGLRLAAGPALERILAGATRTRWHALGSGMLVTAVVQSSSAVTVATIGFVNAGLLRLGGALWVLFGANVGTTMTSWIVALAGLKLSVESLALPLIGLGALLKLAGRDRSIGASGQALFGFGLLFLGISLMQSAFSGFATAFTMPAERGASALMLQVGAGALLTILMQSSSASMTVALTALQQGLLTPTGAAAVAIGANIGTTFTAMLAAIGATPNAQRAATAHVAFNLLTGAVALALLPWLVDAISQAFDVLQLPADAASQLAVFHTVFNVAGVLLMWPLADRLTQWLAGRFRRREEDAGQPRHLDDNVLSVPALAIDALVLESERIGRMTRDLLRGAILRLPATPLEQQRASVQQLLAVAVRFASRVPRSGMPAGLSERLAAALRVLRYHESVLEQAEASSALLQGTEPLPAATAAAEEHFLHCGLALLDALDQREGIDTNALAIRYEAAKSGLLAAGADGTLSLSLMERRLRALSAIRRGLQQAVKASQHASAAPSPPAEDRSDLPA